MFVREESRAWLQLALSTLEKLQQGMLSGGTDKRSPLQLAEFEQFCSENLAAGRWIVAHEEKL